MKKTLAVFGSIMVIFMMIACQNPGLTASDSVIDIAAITGITPPTSEKTPVSTITETDQYTGAVIWTPADGLFYHETIYAATITLTAKNGYTLNGVSEDFFTIAGAESVSNSADSGVVTAIFPVTESRLTVVNFISAEQTGGTSGIVEPTGLILTFDVDPTTLAASDIAVTGATKGALSGTGTTRSLVISDIAVGNGETVSVEIANPSGFTISGSPQTAVVYKVAQFTVTYSSSGHTAGTVPSTQTKVDNTQITVSNGNHLKGPVIVSSKFWQRFTGWNTASDGSGTMYQPGATFTITDDVTLYAQYTTGTDVLRKVGPAGGWIFYDAGSTQSWGRYLEAWTADESEKYKWKISDTRTAGTSTAIGSGYDNTYTAMTGTAHPAAEVVRNATHGGFTDWFLPSRDENKQMYVNLRQEGVGGFVDWYYWSSSEGNDYSAWCDSNNFGKTMDACVRPVRAF